MNNIEKSIVQSTGVTPERMRGVEEKLQDIIRHIYGYEDVTYPSWCLSEPEIKEEECQWLILLKK